jgi:hypothetical protein
MPEQSKYEKIIGSLPQDKSLIIHNERARSMINFYLRDLRQKVHKSESRLTTFIYEDRILLLDQDDSGHNFHLTDHELKACIAAGVIAGVTSTVEWVGEALLQERQLGEN